MKNRFYKMVTACMIGAMAFMVMRIPVYAKGNVDAGITAMLSESLGNKGESTADGKEKDFAGNDAGISAVFSASLADMQESAEPQEAQAEAAQEPALEPEPEPEEPKTICGYTNLGIANVENHLNVREGAGEEFELVGESPVDAGCEILAENGGWY